MRSKWSQICAWLFAAILGCGPNPVVADIQVEVTGVEDELRQNVLVFLSLQRFRDSDDLTADTVERLARRAEREVRQALRPFGYYFPRVSTEVQPPGRNGDWRVRIGIEPGQPVIVEDFAVDLSGEGAGNPELRAVVAQSELRKGRRLIHGEYERLKGDLQRTAVSIGFLEANFSHHELQVDLDRLTAHIRLELATGPRYRFGPTTIEQDAIDEDLARRFVRYREGDYFDAGALLGTQFALEDSLYFSTVEVISAARDEQTLTVPVTITAQPYRRHVYSIGLGYGTDTRWRTTIGWDNRRINTAGHRATVRLTAADIEQSLQARYLIPVGDPALEKLTLDGSLRKEKLADLDIDVVELRPGLTHVRGNWQRVMFVSATRESTDTGGLRTRDVLVVPGISYARVPRGYFGDMLSLRPGFYAELAGSHGVLGSDADFLRLRVLGERVFDLRPGWHLMLRAELGASLVAGFSELPGSWRFFAGGDNSVRGFSLNELSPTEQALDREGNPILDEEGNPTFIKTGGRHLVVGSVELIRDLPRNFGVAVFADAGNAVNKLGDPLEYSVGIGLRWRLPVVTVGIDVAQALSRSGMSPHFHLNISPKL